MVKESTQLDRTFKALGDPTRRAIIERLAESDACVGDLARPFDMSWPAVTKHLDVLEDAGLIVRERRGNTRRCHLVARPMRAATEWMRRYERFWQDRLDALAEYFEGVNRTLETGKRKR